ncbi:AMP-binding protein [Rhodoplanes sp. Z2-YC6860]|uniref:AMP-binding protein n=1 Tax=Rhodoplanes sp. Z2-YC6860 TaxID=674703 RepID=UPI00078C41B3|nr:AMP-binding protein [Rhodoplanes sp. Z2-YC6860]AMN43176.1 Non-ribosomal peptide synthase [Rhodoplanes sp. Z2-YC6860]
MTNLDPASTKASDSDNRLEEPLESGAAFSLERSIIDRFDAVCRQYGSRLAIQDTEVSLAYAELAALVDRIAVAAKAGSEGLAGPIAILLAANARLPAAMLGILAAGRAYVGLDPEFPGERNGLIVAETNACAVVTSGDLLNNARAFFPRDIRVINIDDLAQSPESRPTSRPDADDLAVICFTSGSSGLPKAVAWNHRSLLHWVRVFTETARISCEDKAALLFSPGVSASWRTIYGALLNGGSLHILPPLGLGLSAMIEHVRARGITIYHSVPALMQRLSDALPESARLDSIRIACIGGDRVQWSDIDQCRRIFSREVQVYSVLTSTECGPFIHGFVDETLRATTAHPPAGRPAPGWTASVVNDDGEPALDGEPGELVVTSRFIAVGLWQGSDLRVRPFSTDPGNPELRIYQTGDWALRRPDGLIEFIGRRDRQIKLRGHRINLGDIESALKSCRGVHEAAVIATLDEAGLPQRLVAYCELEATSAHLQPIDLNVMLADILPTFMVPGSIRILDALPRLPNLKIDREGLRRQEQQEQEQRKQDRHFAAPVGIEASNEIQQTLLQLWRDVLGRQDIGIDDDFFLSGGDSLSALDLLHRIEERLQYRLPLAILVAAPSVRQLETRLNTAGAEQISNTVGVYTGGSRRPLFVVPGMFGHAASALRILRSLEADQPGYALQPPGMGWVRDTTLQRAVEYWIGEIKAIQPHGPYRLLGTSFGGLAMFEIALQLQDMGETVEYLAIVDTQPPTCRFDDRLDTLDPLPIPAAPDPANATEALHRRVGATHRQMALQHVLDSRRPFRGELNYFFCTGNPVTAGLERRSLWQQFAARFRLFTLASPHGVFDHEHAFWTFTALLSASLNGEGPAGADPTEVWGRTFSIGAGAQRGKIFGSMGDVYCIQQDRAQGYVDIATTDAEAIRLAGWAVEPDRQMPAQTIVAFAGDRFLCYGAACSPRPDVEKALGRSAEYAGFDFRFPNSGACTGRQKYRLFVLSRDGSAAQLRESSSPESASWLDVTRGLWKSVRTLAGR